MKLLFLPHALRFPLIVIVTLFCKVSPAFSQASNIVPDNTLGESSSQVIENADGQPTEVITGGAQREQNLFHSFQEFNVSEGRGAFFANPEAVSNIFSRVTGSNPSNILGTLGVNGAANLYLINPNGIIFGENSSLDVQGSFSATTGNGIRFGEQGEFNTINPQAPQLLTINPSAYLFNQIAEGDINSIESQGTFLVPEGENLVLLGGDLNLKGGLVVAPGGTVELGSLNDTGEIAIGEDSNLIFPQELARGDISLSDGLFIIVPTVSIAGEGSINVYSQNFNLTERSRMVAGIFQDLGDSDTVGGDVVIDVLGTVSLDDSSISNAITKNASGTTGKIEVEAESVVLQNGGYISTDTLGRGDGGDININATESVIVNEENSDGRASRISSDILPSGQGKAGNLEINTGSLEVTNGSLITSGITGRGDGGDIKINATESVLVDGERSDVQSNQISSIILPEVEVNGREITITITELVIADGENNIDLNSSQISSNVRGGEGKGGNLEINTGSLQITNGGLIISDIFARGEGGDININATESVVVDGENSNGDSSVISSNVREKAEGNAGKIEIDTVSLDVTDGGRIISDIRGIGDGGDIKINATELVVVDGEKDNGDSSVISSRVFSETQGNSGELEINTSSLDVTNGGRIISDILGRGDGGNITITATDSVVVDGQNSNLSSSRISSFISSQGQGNAGELEINTGSLEVTNGALIVSDILGIGDEGNITITATDSVVVDGENSNGEFSSRISSFISSQGQGNAGELEINTGSLRLTNGGRIISDVGGRGEGGDINITATESVVVDGEDSNNFSSQISSNVRRRAEGKAGNLEINTGSLEVTNGGVISSDIRGRGEGGDINITATESVIVDKKRDDNIFSSRISSSVFSNSIFPEAQRKAGDIKINTNSLRLTNGVDISSDVGGRGDGGNITIDATESVIVGEGSNDDLSGISSSVLLDAQGNAGDIEITTNSLKLTNSGRISSNITGTGDGGDITIRATESVIVDGGNRRGASEISSDIGFKGASGNAGELKIITGSLRLTNSGQISSKTFGGGSGGNITIDATESVVIDGASEGRYPVASRISSNSNGVANFGKLEINTNSLRLTDGGQITADNPTGLEDEGNIIINATESVIVDGKTRDGETSRISSNVLQGLNAGNIIIITNLLQLIDGGFISTDAAAKFADLGSGEAGEILIDADIVLLGEDSTITTRSISEGNAGNITLNVSDTLVLENASITSNSSKSAGGAITIDGGDIRLRGDSDIETFVSNGVAGGGDITITADSVIAFDDSDIFAFAREGTGGNIILDTPVFFSENFTFNSLTDNPDFLDNNSRADVNATGAVSGEISIPDLSFVQSSLSELPDNSLNTDELLANSCVVPIGNREQGQFIITGGESLPVRPGDSLPSRYSTGEVRNLPDDNSWQPGDRIVEPQGAYRLNNGKLVLSRECQ